MSSTNCTLIDCFMFNGEDIVKKRLEYMGPHVDRILITEARYTHSGIRKEQLFIDQHANWFEKWHHKITFLVLEEFSLMSKEQEMKLRKMYVSTPQVESWHKENQQRDFASKELVKIQQECGSFQALICDVDEIVHINVLKQLKKGFLNGVNSIKPVESKDSEDSNVSKVMYLEMDFYYYDWRWRKQYSWTAPFVTRFTHINGTSLSDTRYQGYFVKGSGDSATSSPIIPDAGWHLSYFMNHKDLVRKVESLAHGEHNQVAIKSESWMNACTTLGLDLLQRGPGERLGYSNTFYPVILVPHVFKDIRLPSDQCSFLIPSPSSTSVMNHRPAFIPNKHQPLYTWLDQLLLLAYHLVMASLKHSTDIVVDGLMLLSREDGGISLVSLSGVLYVAGFEKSLQQAKDVIAYLPRRIIDRYQCKAFFERSNQELVSATYGYYTGPNQFSMIDVTSQVLKWYTQQELYVPPSVHWNTLFGQDPAPGKPKTLFLNFKWKEEHSRQNQQMKYDEAERKDLSDSWIPLYARMELVESKTGQLPIMTKQSVMDYAFEDTSYISLPSCCDQKPFQEHKNKAYLKVIAQALVCNVQILRDINQELFSNLKELCKSSKIFIVYDDGLSDPSHSLSLPVLEAEDRIYMIGTRIDFVRENYSAAHLFRYNAYDLFDLKKTQEDENAYEVLEFCVLKRLFTLCKNIMFFKKTSEANSFTILLDFIFD